MENGKSFIRHVAIKTSIQNLLDGKFAQDSDNEPSYLLTSENEKIQRVNIIAIVVHKEIVGSITNIMLDDGSGKIMVRQFEESKSLKKLDVGQIALVIGKIRVYNQEKYISPEIITETNSQWLKIRSLELIKSSPQKKVLINKEEKEKEIIGDKKVPEIQPTNEEKNSEKDNNQEIKIIGAVNETNQVQTIMEEKDINQSNGDNDENNDNKQTLTEEATLLPIEKVINIIKEMDVGEGVLIEEVIERSPFDNTEELIQKMLEKGDVFQNQPGKVKVL